MTKVKRMAVRISILLLIAWQSVGFCLAQNANAELHIDTMHLLIGQQTKARLKVEVPQGARIKWGIQADTITRQIEIVSKGKIDTTTANGLTTLNQELILTSFDTGFIPVPPIRFLYQLPGDTSIYNVETEPLLLQVRIMDVDTTAPIRDIKGIQKVGYSWREFLPWIIYLLLALAILWLVRRYIEYRRGKRKYFLIKPKPKLPAWQVALEALENLRQKKLWQAGHTKEYYSALTDIYRDYLKDQFGINAPEMVSHEIVEALRNKRFESLLIEESRRVLEIADLVKFARFEPLPDENDFALEFCRRFVEMTRPTPEPQEAQSQSDKLDKR